MSPAESSRCPPRRRTAQLATGLRLSGPRGTNQTPSAQCVIPRPPSISLPVVMSMVRTPARHCAGASSPQRCRATRSARQTRRPTGRGRRPRSSGAAGQLVGSRERRGGHASRPAHTLVDQIMEPHARADSAVSSVPDDDFSRTLGQDSPFEHLGPETCELSTIVYVNDDAVQGHGPCWQCAAIGEPAAAAAPVTTDVASCCTCSNASN